MARERKCSRCGKPGALPVAWGYPSPEAMEKARRGELILGGCEISGPTWHRLCPECDRELVGSSEGEDPADTSVGGD